MKINKIYLLAALYSLCFTALLQSQAPSFCDQEMLIAFLQEQKERDEALYVLFAKVLSGIKNSNIIIDIENSPHNSNTAHATTDVKTESISRATQNLYGYAQEKLPQAYNSIIANKLKCTAGALLAAYIGLSAYLSYQYYTVYNQKGWAGWCNHLKLSELVCSDCNGLTEKLLKDIHEAYLNQHNVHDIIAPHTQFIHEIDAQINAAHTYIYYYEILNNVSLASAFGLRQEAYAAIKEAQTRLVFIKNLFMNWLNQQA